jgi:hypothetical protein
MNDEMKTIPKKEMDEAVERCFERNKDFLRGYESTPEIRKQVLENLAELWEKHPSMRFGQLLENCVFGHHLANGGCIFHVYDEDTLKNILEALK